MDSKLIGAVIERERVTSNAVALKEFAQLQASELADLRASLDRQAEEVAEVRRQMDLQHHALFARLEEQNSEHAAQTATLRTEIAARERVVKKQHRELTAEITRQSESYAAEREALRTQLKVRDFAIDEIRNPRSWRITAPLRWTRLAVGALFRSAEREMEMNDVQPLFHLDKGLPDFLPIGEGTIHTISGWCFHPTRKVVAVTVCVGPKRFRAERLHLLRTDVAAAYAEGDLSGNGLVSGFSATLAITKDLMGVEHSVVIEVELRGGVRAEFGNDHIRTRSS